VRHFPAGWALKDNEDWQVFIGFQFLTRWDIDKGSFYATNQ
jgi:hypothetical protein